ncbi:DMT family transporter [Macrococcus carouselicus]|uniref:DMT family transporter n=1 Tax=Macrococcus carouselicus TaxID=69969 RepID=A0A9Q8CMB7_9STAP|nr:DMT family transporter [Macrococcus carouselicus]TDM02528.1 DMT family transporter [Macrococcus carouselicus]
MNRYVLLILGVFFLSSSAIFVKLAAAPPGITAFYRMLFSCLLLLPFAVMNKGIREEIRGIDLRRGLLIFTGGILLAVHYILWFQSLDYTSVASSTVIVTLQPLFAVIGGYFLYHERLNPKAVLGIVIAIIGCFVIGYRDMRLSTLALIGDSLALIAAAVITAYFFIGQGIRKESGLIVYSVLGYGSSACFLFLYCLIQGNDFIHYSSETFLYLIALALFATILGQTIFNFLLRWLNTTVISMAILGEVIGTCLLGYIFLHERISVTQFIGIAIILLGQAVFILYSRETKNP